MESSSFIVPVEIFYKINPSNSLKKKEILVPRSFLGCNGSTEVIGLERRDPKLAEKGLPIEAKRINLSEYYMIEGSRESVFAHAVANHHHMNCRPLVQPIFERSNLIDYIAGDQFFLPSELNRQETRWAKKGPTIEMHSLRTGRVGPVPVNCLTFFPRMKVKEAFEWNGMDGAKIKNEKGQHFTIVDQSWILSWAPGDKMKYRDLWTFGRNIQTGYSGMVPVDKIEELEPSELQLWMSIKLMPIKHLPRTANLVFPQAPCERGECDCQEKAAVDIVEEERRQHQAARAQSLPIHPTTGQLNTMADDMSMTVISE